MVPLDSAAAITDAIRGGRASAVEICREALDRIARLDGSLHAFLARNDEGALRRAAELDARRHDWDELPLLGVPIAIKDNICTRDLPTTAGSQILKGYTPPYNATVIERLLAAGAVPVAKTNCDEFAMGSSTENSAFGVTRNPWAPDRIPGGSSGGSAAAVAARMVTAALGSDTGGSIRQPASLCGVVGVKPTYGRVSRYGLIAFASSLDSIGPITTNVDDAAAVLQAISGPDPLDATSQDQSGVPDFTSAIKDGIRGLRIGVPRGVLKTGVDAEVLGAFEAALESIRKEGATTVDVDLAHNDVAVSVYYLVNTAEASSNLSRYDGVRYGFRAANADTLSRMYDETRDEGFGAEVKRRIMLGTYVLSAGYYDAYYRKAQQVRTLIRRDYDAAFERVDLIALPTSPVPAFRLGERLADPLQMYLADVFTVGASLAGLPAISVPCGFTSEGLPVGLQFAARAFDEATMLRAAAAYERLTDFSQKQPRVA